ncbi:MAG: hypothetical protein QXV44_01560, partial [Candidatus Anstonellaceae archaeon]
MFDFLKNKISNFLNKITKKEEDKPQPSKDQKNVEEATKQQLVEEQKKIEEKKESAPEEKSG